MPDARAPQLPRIVVRGGEHVALAVSLARAGCTVALCEPDPHDRTRLRDVLGRAGLPDSLSVVADAHDCPAPDMILANSAERRPEPVPVLSLDWARASGTAIHLSALPGQQPLLERIGPDTRGAVAALASALGARVVALPCNTVPPSERLMAVLSAEIEALVLTGPTPEEIDDALVAADFALGPFEAQDIAGIDTCLAARRAVLARHPGPQELPLFARAVAEGRLGRKVGVGWYRYPGGGGKVEDPLVEDMAIEEARFAGLPRADLGTTTIRQRVIDTLRAEAKRIAAEGVLAPRDIDEIAQLSVGAPPGLTL